MIKNTKMELSIPYWRDIRIDSGTLGDLLRMWAGLAANVEDKVALNDGEVLSWKLKLDREAGYDFLDAICELHKGDNFLAAVDQIHIFSECFTDGTGKYEAHQLAEKIATVLKKK